ncbi:uncharacterized protein LOC127593732 [Hippocampus zosterae]|uniref:uncharacterized protein LOC127593732 n=1 Tax=Hippocampus zosterae TaxID=109293 RepID=UPI00223D51CA|nr:uncharacterized protein LOC127593732 [Hippocampus zosterae]
MQRTADYEDDFFGAKEDNDAVLEKSRVGWTIADAGPRQQEPEYPHIKEEVEDERCPCIQEKDDEGHTHIKEEEEEHLRTKEDEGKPPYIKEEEKKYICKLLSTGIPLKIEDEGQSEPSRGARPLSSRISSQHTTTKGDGGHCEGSQVNSVLVPNKQAVDEAVVNMIIRDCQPLSIVENEGFREFLKLIMSSYAQPSRKTIKDLVSQRYEKEKEKTKRTSRAPLLLL